MADNKRLLSLVGLATRARKVVSGEFSTEKSVKSGKSHLVIVSEAGFAKSMVERMNINGGSLNESK